MSNEPDMYANLAESFDPFCCPGCGVSDGELHRPGCLEGAYEPTAWRVARIFEASRDTPARAKPLRIRVCPEPLGGPHWLSLLAQCAWLRGGIIGSGPADTWVGTERTPERLLRQERVSSESHGRSEDE